MHPLAKPLTVATALLVALPAAAPAAQVALHESFSFTTTGVFPPAGWTETDLNGAALGGWSEIGHNCASATTTTDVAGHDAFGTLGFQETRLASPAMDLTGFVAPRLNVHAWGCNTWALTSSGQGYADDHFIEVSTDGGASWTVEWLADSGGANDYELLPLTLDLSGYAGASSMQVGFRYLGDSSQWTIDNFLVIDAPTAGTLHLIGSCGAPGSYVVAFGVTPLATVAFAWSPTAGGRIYSSPNCPAVASGLGLYPPRLAGVTQASSFGWAQIIPPNGIPAGACGGFVQAFDLVTCLPTEVLQL